MGSRESTAATSNALTVSMLRAIAPLLDAFEEYGLIKAGGGHPQT